MFNDYRRQVLLTVTLGYGVVNIGLMTLFARGAIGRTPPWSVLYAFVGVSGVGALICLILLAAADRSQISWRIALACTVGFGFLTLFNVLSYAAASAAV